MEGFSRFEKKVRLKGGKMIFFLRQSEKTQGETQSMLEKEKVEK